MSLLDRLAHSRALDRVGGRPQTRAAPATRVDASVPAFERRERTIELEPASRLAGVLGQRLAGNGIRASLLGGCLDRLRLPSAASLARDLICLGASEAGRAVFLDTETTGLAGASVAFIVGIAWIDREPPAALRCVQWTLTRCSGEAALLSDLFATLEQQGPAPLVTFNGASFDVPLLRLRARHHRLSARALDAAHVDLLHPARRLHRGRGSNCKLGTLERELLGVHRRADIESAEIPEVFWTWQAAPQDPHALGRLTAVLDHNLADVATLPALAAWLGAAIREPTDLDRALRAARHLEQIGASDQARLVLSRWVLPDSGLRPTGRGGLWRKAALELANYERRAENWEQAATLWRAAWMADPGCPSASEAWAKHLEHRVEDFGEALRVARGSREPCERRILRLEGRASAKLPVAPVEVLPDAPSEARVAARAAAEASEPSPPRRSELLARIGQTQSGAVVRYRLLR